MKRGVSQWISWVMLTAFVVIVGVTVLQWSRSQTTSTVEDLVEKGDILAQCQETGLSLDGYCQKTQTLNMNVTNNNNRKVEGVLVRGLDIYGSPQDTQKNLTVAPGQSRSVEFVKKGVLRRAEVLPTIVVGKKRVVCQSRALALDSIPFC